MGPVSLLIQEQAVAGLVVTHTLRVDSQLQEEETLDSQLKSFWELESLGQPTQVFLGTRVAWTADSSLSGN